MREVTKFDDRRSVEVTIYLNADDEVIGADVYLCTPVPLHDFSFSKVGLVKQCGGCSDKGLPLSASAAIPNPRS
jgi:hypothetical protein